jgi:NarL family two-component system response regulator LiaR
MPPITIALVDDHRVVTRSLQAFLESFADMRVVGIASSGEALLERLTEWKPQVVLQDLLMPGGLDGVETIRRVLLRDPGVRVVALTASSDEARMLAALRAGARGYVRKEADPETLLAAIRAVARGETYVDPAAGHGIARALDPVDPLTPRERDILRQVASGRSNKEIAAALTITEETVKTHVANLFGKLQVDNRAQAVVQALRRGLLALDDLE